MTGQVSGGAPAGLRECWGLKGGVGAPTLAAPPVGPLECGGGRRPGLRPGAGVGVPPAHGCAGQVLQGVEVWGPSHLPAGPHPQAPGPSGRGFVSTGLVRPLSSAQVGPPGPAPPPPGQHRWARGLLAACPSTMAGLWQSPTGRLCAPPHPANPGSPRGSPHARALSSQRPPKGWTGFGEGDPWVSGRWRGGQSWASLGLSLSLADGLQKPSKKMEAT